MVYRFVYRMLCISAEVLLVHKDSNSYNLKSDHLSSHLIFFRLSVRVGGMLPLFKGVTVISMGEGRVHPG